MKGIIIVETKEEYDSWLAGQKPQYLTVQESLKSVVPAAITDSLKTTNVTVTSKPIAQNFTK
jgi:heme/copper-type cytochrome/quinol oxidase subunit 2